MHNMMVFQHLSNCYAGVIILEVGERVAVEPGLREPAPRDLRLVQAFVNTNDIEEGRDQLDGPEALRDWLISRGLIESGVDVRDRDLARALLLREAIRGLAAANNGISPPPDVLDALDRIADACAMRVRFTGADAAHLEPLSPGVGGALARIVADVYRSMIDGTWPRLKACRRHGCRWLFYDRSRNRSGTWCAMEVCGNRTKTRRYRRRRAGEVATG
jgi:predicted RNA-binding Zn ribbon-like protein